MFHVVLIYTAWLFTQIVAASGARVGGTWLLEGSNSKSPVSTCAIPSLDGFLDYALTEVKFNEIKLSDPTNFRNKRLEWSTPLLPTNGLVVHCIEAKALRTASQLECALKLGISTQSFPRSSAAANTAKGFWKHETTNIKKLQHAVKTHGH